MEDNKSLSAKMHFHITKNKAEALVHNYNSYYSFALRHRDTASVLLKQ